MSKNIAMVISLVLDESSSMSCNRATTIESVNKYIKEQKEKSREDVLFSLTKFNTQSEIAYKAMPIEKVPQQIDMSADVEEDAGSSAK